MRPNCPLCGRHLSLEEARDRENTAIAPNGTEIVICSNCGEKKHTLEERLKGASPSQIKVIKTKENAGLIDIIQREQNLKEQVIVPYQPAPEIPAQPVVPIGPVTIEQKIAAIEDRLVKLEKDIANILGMLGQRG